MADDLHNAHAWPRREPLIPIVPENASCRPDDWQSRWENEQTDCRCVDLGMCDDPHRSTWVNTLDLAIRRVRRPVLLVAHGLGCLAAAWPAEYERPAFGDPVLGAMLGAPPDIDRPGLHPRLARFGVACFTPHTAFHDSTARFRAPERESIETRALVISPD